MRFLRESWFSLGLFFAVLSILLYGLETTQAGSDLEALRIVTESITRSVVSCYAIEGVYPQSLDYLIEEYGLYIDQSKYSVQYTIFASNIMPQVTVIEVSP